MDLERPINHRKADEIEAGIYLLTDPDALRAIGFALNGLTNLCYGSPRPDLAEAARTNRLAQLAFERSDEVIDSLI